MSTQKGNTKKCRHQKYQNNTGFKNTRYDVSTKLKQLNNFQITGVCQRCKEKIEWKIKYKKYKPLTAPRRCNNCGVKAVKRAYHILCTSCASLAGVCAMCNEKVPIVHQSELDTSEQASQKSEIENELRMMSERERRTFMRKNLEELTAKRRANLHNFAVDDEDDSDENINLDLKTDNEPSMDKLSSSLKQINTSDFTNTETDEVLVTENVT